jgi:hypothetical protein
MRIAAAVLMTLLASSAFGRGVEIPAWVRGAIPAELPPAGEADAQVLLDHQVVQISLSGQIVLRHRRVVKILTAAGRSEAYLYVPFDDDSKVLSLAGWSIDPQGREYALRDKEAMETSLADYELYTDAKVKVLQVPGDIGSIVAFEYSRNERPYLLQSTWHFQENVPVLYARYEVQLPPNWSYDAKWMNYAAAEPIDRGVWELRSIPAVIDEPRRPSTLTIAGRVGFNFLPADGKPLGWTDVAKWFSQLAIPRSIATPQLQAKVQELTKDDDEPMIPLARFAQRDVRYVAVEVGIGGYQPHPAGDVFKNRYGDCKDKATLLRTMLKEVGIDAYYVLVHATRGAADPAFPTIGAFNHVVAAIPVSAEKAKQYQAIVDHPKLGKLLIFDPTSTLTPFGQLPDSLQASRGLLVTNDGGEMIDLPAQKAEASQLVRVAKLQLDAKGTLSGTVEETRSGSAAASMRGMLQALSAAERVHSIESQVSSHLAVATTDDVSIEFLDEPESDLVIRYRFTAPNYAKRVADMLLIRPRVLGAKAEAQIDAKRTQPYVTDGPALHRDEIEIRMPATVKLDELPAKVEIRTPLVQYASASTFADGVLRYERRYALNTYAIPREAFTEMNGAWKQIVADERASAVFK